jgi:hypothetical protein
LLRYARFDEIPAESSARSASGPDCVKTRMLRFAGAAVRLMKPSLCPDRFHQAANA